MCFLHELFIGTPPLTTMTCGEHQKFHLVSGRWGDKGTSIKRLVVSPGGVRACSWLVTIVRGGSGVPNLGAVCRRMETLRWRARPTLWRSLSTSVSQLNLQFSTKRSSVWAPAGACWSCCCGCDWHARCPPHPPFFLYLEFPKVFRLESSL